jgi:hypothetical protein
MTPKKQIPTIPVGEVVGMIEELRSIDRHKEIEQQAAKLNMTYEQYCRWYRNEYGKRLFPSPDSQSLFQIKDMLSKWQDRLRKYETGSLEIENDIPLPENYVDNAPRSNWKKLAAKMNVGDSVLVMGWNEATSLKTALHTRWGMGCSVSRKAADTDSSVYFPVRVWRTK